MSHWFALLLLLLLCAFALSDDSVEKIPAVQKCYMGCPKMNEAACRKGCMFSYALTFAPKDYAHNPSCSDSCIDGFTEAEDQAACRIGCGNFQPEVPSVPLLGATTNFDTVSFLRQKARAMAERIRKLFGHFTQIQHPNDAKESESAENFFDPKIGEMFQRIRSIFANSVSEHQGLKDTDQEDPVVNTRVRIIILSRPEEGNAEVSDSAQASDAQNSPDSFISSKIAETQAVANPNAYAGSGRSSGCHNIVVGLRRVFTNPFNLMLVVTMFVLFVLFIVQILLYVRRRPKRSHGHQYTRLPTYAEAVEIKIPLDVDEHTFQATEKSKIPKDEVQA